MQKAFSLVELSIVLVILGLLTGGVIAGQSLMRAAELRNVTVEAANYTAAIHTFRDKYFSLPGDMRNALSFWPDAKSTCPAINYSLPSNETSSCNGNGDGIIQAVDSTNSAAPHNYANETHWAWQHLQKAGLISGSYNGVTYGASKAGKRGAWRIFGTRVGYSWDNKYYGYGNSVKLGNHLEFTGIGTNHSGYFEGSLSTEEAWNIDTKQDDGKPGTGNIKGPGQHYHSNGAQACTTSSNAAAAEYNLTNIDYFTPNGYAVPSTSLWCELIFQPL